MSGQRAQDALFGLVLFLGLGLLLPLKAPAAEGNLQAGPMLEGRVVDSQTGEPIADAHVRVLEGWRGEVTDDRGEFAFFTLPGGRITLRISHVGYEEREVTVQVGSGVPVFLPVALSPRTYVEGAVTLRESPVPPGSHVITRDELDRRGKSDLAGALETIPGVQINRPGGEGGRATLSLHGGRHDQVRVLLDGVPLSGGDGGGVDLSSISPTRVKQIRVDPAASPGAPGGTVEILSLDPARSPGWAYAASEHKWPEAWRLTGSLGRDGGDWAGMASASFLTSPGNYPVKHEWGEERGRTNNERQRLLAHARLRRQWDGPWSFTADLGGESSHFGSPGPLYQPPTTAASHQREDLRGTIKLEHRPDRWHSVLALHTAASDRRYSSPRRQRHPSTGAIVLHTPADYEDKSRRGGLSGQLRAFWRSDLWQPLTLAGQYQLESFRSLDHLGEGTALRTGDEIRRASAALSVEEGIEWQLWGLNPSLEGLVRWEGVHDEPGTTPSPFSPGAENHLGHRVRLSGGQRWDQGGWRAYLQHANAIHVPDFTSRFLVENAFALGNANLASERVREWYGGLSLHGALELPGTKGDGNTAEMDAKDVGWRGGYLRWQWGAALFLREMRDQVVWRRNWRGQYQPANLARSEARGLELTLELQPPGYVQELQGALTFQRARNTTPGSPWEGNHLPFQADLYGNVRLVAGDESAVLWSLESRFAGRRYTTESNLDPLSLAGGGLDPYAVFDLQGSHRFPLGNGHGALRLTAGVENLLDEEYALMDRMPMPGRIWRLGLAWRKGQP